MEESLYPPILVVEDDRVFGECWGYVRRASGSGLSANCCITTDTCGELRVRKTVLGHRGIPPAASGRPRRATKLLQPDLGGSVVLKKRALADVTAHDGEALVAGLLHDRTLAHPRRRGRRRQSSPQAMTAEVRRVEARLRCRALDDAGDVAPVKAAGLDSPEAQRAEQRPILYVCAPASPVGRARGRYLGWSRRRCPW